MLGEKARAKIQFVSSQLGVFFGKLAPPNFYTVLTLVSGLLAAYFIWVGSFLAGIVLLLLSGFFDLLDGAVARAAHRTTKWGAMLDSVTDKITELAIYGALAFYSAEFVVGAILASNAFMLSSYVSKHAGAIGAKSGGGLLERKERLFLLVIGFLAIPYGTIYMEYILYIIAFFSLVTAAQRLWRTKKAVEKPESEKK